MPLPHPFPNLNNPATVTSPQNGQYNCIAWAFCDNTQWWWPRHAFWPISVQQGHTTLQAFEALFESDDWVETADSTLETGLTKVALYAKAGVIQHAARQLPTGEWTSKLGQNVDIAHSIGELEGPKYGTLFRIYAKPI